MKTLSKIFGGIATVSAVIIVVLSIAFAAPILFGFQPRVVLSGSMEPMIPVGSVVYINQKDTMGEIGKVVAYRIPTVDGETHVIHRIVDRNEKGFITQGDNNDEPDMIILRPENIIGAYGYHIPFLGYMLAKKMGVLLGIVLWLGGMTGIAVLLDVASD